MKKNRIAAVLGIAMAACIIGTGVSKVSADQGTESSVETDMEAAGEVPGEDAEEQVEAGTEKEVIDGETEVDEEQTEDVESVAESEITEEPEEITGMKVILENTLEADVTSVEISSFSGEVFSGNLLLNDTVLKVNDSCTIGIPEEFQDQELGMYNVRITMTDGSVTEIPFVPFLEDMKGTLYRQNETVLIQIRDSRLEAEAEVISESEMMQREAEASEIMAEALTEEIE